MPENNPPQPLPEPNAGDANASPPPPAANAEKKRRRRRWPFVIAGIVVFILLLGLFAPTLLSIGPARSMVLGIVNDNLDGKLEVADWSLGWNSGDHG